MTIPKNGFIGLWLPRKETFDIIITKDNKASTKTITTNKGDNTCITDITLISYQLYYIKIKINNNKGGKQVGKICR